MALPHAQPGVPVEVQPYGTSLGSQKTTALFKSDTLEVIRLVLTAGKRLPAHQVQGELTIQCLAGQLAVIQGASRQTLGAGQLLFLPAQTMHEIEAELDSSALITIVLHSH
ncbi:cupin [Comamonas testosteroni]|uniref:cupin n=1 Tax=Comamonas testosteroni TaxID=285 RepID=UPI0038998752